MKHAEENATKSIAFIRRTASSNAFLTFMRVAKGRRGSARDLQWIVAFMRARSWQALFDVDNMHRSRREIRPLHRGARLKEKLKIR
jgi:hypothetical protein